MTHHRTIIFAAAALSIATSAQAAQLRDHQGVNNGLVTAGIVETIYETCPTISVRKLSGLLYLRSLYTMARNAGFSEAEIEAYVESDAEEARLRVHVDRYLVSKGAVAGDPESYCAVGRAEIAAESKIGSFLRVD